MGSSSWSDDFYRDRVADRKATGKPTFSHDADVKSGKVDKKVHNKLSPKGVTRESRDSKEHPNSVAIGVVFDTTGSMSSVPMVLQKKLPQLMGLLLRKGYVQDPQILFGAVADFFSERDLCLQIGQFESGIEMDDDVTRLVLTGGGGGSNEESYNLALQFFAKHTSIDCFEKRGKKGYLFIIGDEQPYETTTPDQLEQILGDTAQADLSIEEIVRQVKERYEVFYLIPKGTNHWDNPAITRRWAELVGDQHVVRLEDPEAVCEAIGLAIGLVEGTADASRAASDLAGVGVDAHIAHAAITALDPLAKSALVKVGTGGMLPEAAHRSGAVERF